MFLTWGEKAKRGKGEKGNKRQETNPFPSFPGYVMGKVEA
jgi:hypothetical protein